MKSRSWVVSKWRHTLKGRRGFRISIKKAWYLDKKGSKYAWRHLLTILTPIISELSGLDCITKTLKSTRIKFPAAGPIPKNLKEIYNRVEAI